MTREEPGVRRLSPNSPSRRAPLVGRHPARPGAIGPPLPRRPPVASLPPPEVSVSRRSAGVADRRFTGRRRGRRGGGRAGAGVGIHHQGRLRRRGPGEGRRPALRDRPARVSGRGRPCTGGDRPVARQPHTRERGGDAHATPEVVRGGERTRGGHRHRQQGRDGGRAGDRQGQLAKASSTSSSPRHGTDRGAGEAVRRSPPAAPRGGGCDRDRS